MPDHEPDRQHCKQGGILIPPKGAHTSDLTVRASCVSFRDRHAECQLDCMDAVEQAHIIQAAHGRQRLSVKTA